MDFASCIEQKGVIENIENGVANVNITTFTACAHCHAKNACNISAESSRIIQVPVGNESYTSGELVRIIMKRSLGMRAAFFAYIFPFILVLGLLIVLTSLKISELFAGLSSIILLVPYFLGLHLFRERLKRTFTFTLQKEV